jgi:hypothetical protein
MDMLRGRLTVEPWQLGVVRVFEHRQGLRAGGKSGLWRTRADVFSDRASAALSPVQATIRLARRRRSRTYQPMGYIGLPVLKTGWATGPLPPQGAQSMAAVAIDA